MNIAYKPKPGHLMDFGIIAGADGCPLCYDHVIPDDRTNSQKHTKPARPQRPKEQKRKMSGGKHTLTIKLDYGGSCFEGGARRKENARVAKAGDYMVMGFVRMEK